MAAAAAAAITTTPVPVRAGEFEGPLDLLLELVRRNQVSIESMPIAEITRQYLAYLKEAERANVNLGAEFIYMAATLIQIKSRLLLPQEPSLAAARRGASEEELDPQKALLDRLREHAQARAAAEMLKTKLEVEETTWSHHGRRDDELSASGDAVVLDRQTAAPRQPTLADLIDTLGDALRRVRSHTTMAVEADTVTVEDRMHWLREHLRSGGNATAARRRYNMSELFGQQPTPAARCCLFLGMLELGRHGEVRIEQSEPFGEVTVAPVC